MVSDTSDDGVATPRILLEAMVHEVEFTARAAVRAARALLEPGRETGFWDLAETFLHFGALTASFFWPSDQRRKPLKIAFPNRGRDLRGLFGLDDGSPFGDLRRIRDGAVHLDERLEEWWLEQDMPGLAIRNFGDVRMVPTDARIYHFWDPDNGVLVFSDHRVDIRASASMLDLIANRARHIQAHWRYDRAGDQAETPGGATQKATS